MPIKIGEFVSFCGRELSADELNLIRQIVGDFPALSQWQLAATICELLDWRRPNGSLKTRECFSFLQQLEERGWLHLLPALRITAPRGPRSLPLDEESQARTPLSGSLKNYRPITLQLITQLADRRLFNQYIQRHHYLGYRIPVGAQLRYFARHRDGDVIACLLFTSAAWKMAARDSWIGWDETTRRSRLGLVVNQSRFLILPWVRIPDLASHILSLAARQLPGDWEAFYNKRPLMLESLVDAARFLGTCYRAANWIHIGSTRGRGRMDRHYKEDGRAPKRIFIYPLTRHARRLLSQPESYPVNPLEPWRDCG